MRISRLLVANRWEVAVRVNRTASEMDGKVLSIGGYIDVRGGSDGDPTSGEIYDPATNHWTVTAPLPTPEGLGPQLLTVASW